MAFDLNQFLENGFNAYASYNNQKAEASKADQAQQNAQASMNNANIMATISKNKTTLAIVGGVVAVVVAYFLFGGKRR